MSRVLIIGYGTVGSNLVKELAPLNPEIYDKYKPPFIRRPTAHYDFAFICVDTPLTPNGKELNTVEVINAIHENDASVYVIKSTVPPGTTSDIAALGRRVVFSPEYYGGTQHCNNYQFDFTILGGERNDCLEVQQLLQQVYDGRHIFRITDAKTAELVKFMENSFLATKVSFCVQFWEIAHKFGINYEELRELFVLDPRVNPSHTFVYNDKPFWESHCLDKDVPAAAHLSSAEFLDSVIKYNNECCKKYKSCKV